MSSAIDLKTRIFIAGHQGMVGSAIMRKLKKEGFKNIITASRSELDLCNQGAVKKFFETNLIDYVVIAAAKVGGILANTNYPVEFLSENLSIQNNLITQSYKSGIKELLFLGSSCIYPKNSKQPMHESELLSGHLQPNNEPYAIAKIAGIKLCESYNREYGTDYRSVMPTNLYGPNDNYHKENSHVMPALIRRFHEAKINNEDIVSVWGTGSPRREFLHVDDMADACLHIMKIPKEQFEEFVEPMVSHINVGCGEEITISNLAELIKKVTSFKGGIVFDDSYPDGVDKKLLDVSKLKDMGWIYKISLEEGLKNTYEWYANHPFRE
mgnify:CR=1 FL=1